MTQPHNQKSDVKSIVKLLSLIKDYFFDHEGELRQLITWFLNFTIDEEIFL
jgi:hypothetical protein